VRILVAEDDPGLRSVLERGLRENGYAVDAVADGEQALAYLRAYEYSAVVLDWRMPGMSGIDVLRHARARRLATPVLMLTARDATADRVTGLDTGADDYLVKPFQLAELLARLRALPMAGSRQPPGAARGTAADPHRHRVLHHRTPAPQRAGLGQAAVDRPPRLG
jgi:DNA-binding response OmpR family regulator